MVDCKGPLQQYLEETLEVETMPDVRISVLFRMIAASCRDEGDYQAARNVGLEGMRLEAHQMESYLENFMIDVPKSERKMLEEKVQVFYEKRGFTCTSKKQSRNDAVYVFEKDNEAQTVNYDFPGGLLGIIEVLDGKPPANV